MTESPTRFKWGVGSWVVFVFLPLAAGLLLMLLIPSPKIGIIRLDEAIGGESAKALQTQITYARENTDIKAIVLVLNTPGGTVTDTEAVYMELARLRQRVPVITVVEGMAASGGYYLSVGTDYIISKPSSLVGNIGVIGVLPPPTGLIESIVSTGPYKMFGSPREEYMRQTEMMKQGFYKAVTLGRGAALKAGPDVVLSGQIWPGSEALRLGIVDALGTQTDGIEKAAAWAGLRNYQVVDLRKASGLPDFVAISFYGQAPDGKPASNLPAQTGLYYLYLPPAEVKP